MKMSIKRASRFLVSLSVITLTGTFAMFILLSKQKDKLLNTMDEFGYLRTVVDELWDVSLSLTNYSRLYVASGDITYYESYNKLLAWRNDEMARPADEVSFAQGEKISELDIFKASGATEDEVALYEQSIALSENLAKLETQAMESKRTNRFVPGLATLQEGESINAFAIRILFDGFYQGNVKKIKEPLNILYERFETRSEEVIQREKLSYNILGAVTFVCLICVAAVVIITLSFVSRKFLKPVLGSAHIFDSLGEGDLTVTMKVKDKNEMSKIAQGLNTGIGNLRNLIVIIKKNSAFLDKVSVNLATNINAMAASIRQINTGIDETKNDVQTQSSGVTETASTIEEMIRTISSLSDNIQQQSANIIEASSSVEQMIANINQITHTLENNNELMKNLNEQTTIGKNGMNKANAVITKIAERTDSLLEASSVIQNIAGQTNLLAMNAAIEAAHAGDSGKGFAVVADEIRKLAEESNMQGREISKALKETTGIIKELVAAGGEAEHAFGQTVELAEKIARQENSITLSMQEQANGSKEVLQAMREINESTQQVDAGSKEMLLGSEGVAKEMKQLSEITVNINNRMIEVAGGATQINAALVQVDKLTDQNKNMIQHLNKEVSKFTV